MAEADVPVAAILVRATVNGSVDADGLVAVDVTVVVVVSRDAVGIGLDGLELLEDPPPKPPVRSFSTSSICFA